MYRSTRSNDFLWHLILGGKKKKKEKKLETRSNTKFLLYFQSPEQKVKSKSETEYKV